MSLDSFLKAHAAKANRDRQGAHSKGSAVTSSHDLQRILALPRRKLNVNDDTLAKKWTQALTRGEVKCDCKERWGYCIKELKPIQGHALEEAARMGGLLAPIGVGHGKTGIDILLACVIPGVKIAALLVPPGLRNQLINRDFEQWSVHFKTPNLAGGKKFTPGLPTLHVVGYSEVSQTKNSDLFKRIGADLIIADEAHNLKNPTAARTIRFLKSMASQSHVKFVALSGTMTSKSIVDYAHLSGFSLKSGSPLPLDPATVNEWALALDPIEVRADAGKLAALCDGVEDVRHGFRRRLVSTPGVIASEEGSIMSSLVLRERKVTLPPEIKKALSDVRKTWTRPDGEEFQEAIQLYQCLQQLACGFFYRWKFVRGETPEQIETWLARRSAYNREVRDALKRPRDFLDSPGCLRKAAERYYAGEQETEERPHWRSLTLRDWAEVEDTVQPVTEAVWLSEYLIDDVAEWAKKNTGIIWYQHAEFGKRLEKRLKLPRYGGGPEAAAAIENEKGDRSVIASIDSHSTGRNLQRAFSVNLVCTPPSANTTWEQMLGRTHRQGQEADEVSAEVYRHTEEFREAIDTAVGRAYYVLETTGASQKLSYADVEWR